MTGTADFMYFHWERITLWLNAGSIKIIERLQVPPQTWAFDIV